MGGGGGGGGVNPASNHEMLNATTLASTNSNEHTSLKPACKLLTHNQLAVVGNHLSKQ